MTWRILKFDFAQWLDIFTLNLHDFIKLSYFHSPLFTWFISMGTDKGKRCWNWTVGRCLWRFYVAFKKIQSQFRNCFNRRVYIQYFSVHFNGSKDLLNSATWGGWGVILLWILKLSKVFLDLQKFLFESFDKLFAHLEAVAHVQKDFIDMIFVKWLIMVFNGFKRHNSLCDC